VPTLTHKLSKKGNSKIEPDIDKMINKNHSLMDSAHNIRRETQVSSSSNLSSNHRRCIMVVSSKTIFIDITHPLHRIIFLELQSTSTINPPTSHRRDNNHPNLYLLDPNKNHKSSRTSSQVQEDNRYLARIAIASHLHIRSKIIQHPKEYSVGMIL